MDLATLAVKVETVDITGVAVSLDRMAASGKRAEAAANDLGRAATSSGKATEDSGRKTLGVVRYQEQHNREVERALKAQRDHERALRATSGGLTEHQRRLVGATAANDNFNRSMTRSEVAMGQATGAAGRLRVAIGGMLGAFAGFAGVRMLGSLSDQWSELQSRVTNASGSLEAGRANLDRISEMAARTYSSLQATTDSWLAQKLALDELGLSTSEQLDLVATLNNALVISSTRGERAASVQKAFSDAMATGALRTEGLNTILAGSPRLAQALADSMGVTISQLRVMGTEGTITGDKLVGITSQLGQVSEEADAMAATIGDGMVRIQNSMLRFVGAADQAGGSSSALAVELVKISDWIDANGHLAAQMGDDIASSVEMIRSLASDITSAYEMAHDAMSGIHQGVNDFLASIGVAKNEATGFGSEWFDGMARVRGAFADLALEAVARISAIPSAGKAAYDTFVDGWRQFPAAIGGIIVEGAAKTLEVIEGMVDGAVGILNYIPGVDITARAAGQASGGLRARFGTDGGEAAKGFVDGFMAEFEANQARVREGFTSLASGIGDVLGYETREAAQVREAYVAVTGAAETAWSATKEWLFGTRDEASATGAVIRSGVTQPTKEAEQALRDAEAARKALFSEADSAVAKFFPFETAVADAERLMGIVNDMENGLSDCQRPAARLDAEMVFNGLKEAA